MAGQGGGKGWAVEDLLSRELGGPVLLPGSFPNLPFLNPKGFLVGTSGPPPPKAKNQPALGEPKE